MRSGIPTAFRATRSASDDAEATDHWSMEVGLVRGGKPLDSGGHHIPTETPMRRALDKVLKDNITMLASVVAWGVLSSVIPIVVGLLAISGLVLHGPVKQRVVVVSLSQALQHVLTTSDLRALVHLVVDHTGLLGILGAVGILWGASN